MDDEADDEDDEDDGQDDEDDGQDADTDHLQEDEEDADDKMDLKLDVSDDEESQAVTGEGIAVPTVPELMLEGSFVCLFVWFSFGLV